MWHRYNRRYNLLLVGRQRFDVVGEVDVEALDAADTERQENSEAIAVQAAAGYTVNRRGAEIAGGDEGGQLDGDDANRLSIVGVAADVLREGGLGAVCFVKLLGDAGFGIRSAISGLAENTSTADRIKVADIDMQDSILAAATVTLTGADASAFEVSGKAVYLTAGTILDFETKTSFSAVVTFTGGAFDIRGSLVSPLTVAVTDVVEDWNVTVGETASSTDTVTRTGSSRLVKHGSGSLVLDRANSHTGGVLVTAGEIIVRHLSALGTGILEVRAGAKVTLDIGSVNWNGGTNFIALAGISLDPAGRLEVGTGQISVAAGNYDLSSIRSAISSGRNGGQWNGQSGFTSAAAGRGTFRAIGYRVMPATNELRLGFAAFGDTNLDGRITTTDIALVNNAGRFGQETSTSTTWADGDFNYDGRVTSTDVGLLNNTGLFGKGSYLPVTPAASSLQAAAATAGATISSDTWAAYALAGESTLGKKKKR